MSTAINNIILFYGLFYFMAVNVKTLWVTYSVEGLGTADVSSGVGGVCFQCVGEHLNGLQVLVHFQHIDQALVHIGHGYRASRPPKKLDQTRLYWD